MQRLHAEYQTFLAAVLRSEAPAWPDAANVDVMLKLGSDHGVNGLVHAAYRRSQYEWPRQYVDGLKTEARQQTGQEIMRRRELVDVLKAFAAAGVQPLVLKGAALAYTYYSSAALRPRCDIDLLVREDDLERCDKVLGAIGYQLGFAWPGRLITHESCYLRFAAGIQHFVDLHWKINNRHVFARTFDYKELVAEAMPVEQLGKNALALCPEHALLLACMHRAVNLETGQPGERLIWLYDIQLLVNALSAEQWEHTCRLAREKGIAAVARDAIQSAALQFGALQVAPEQDLRPQGYELSARMLGTSRRRRIMTDFAALDWSDRLQLLREVLFPPSEYLRNRYGSRAALLKHLKTLITSPWQNLQRKP